MSTLLQFYADDEAATAIEYGLLAAMISVFLIGAIYTFSAASETMWTDLSTHIASSSN